MSSQAAAARKLEARLGEALHPEAARILAAIERAADHLGARAYLVGGVVRDLLTDRAVEDIDIVVEGDALELARSLPSELGLVRQQYPSFGTATLQGASQRVDLATARSETYARPGALPVVRPADLTSDLGRRDFSVNSMAFSLHRGHSERFHDPHRGLADIGRRRLRILHDDSFIDDPTRAFRGLRFEQRLGFQFADSTEVAVRSMADGDSLDGVSGERVFRELRLTLELPRRVEDSFRRMESLGLLEAVTSGLEFPLLAEKGFERIDRFVEEDAESRTASEVKTALWQARWILWMTAQRGGVPEKMVERLNLSKAMRRITLGLEPGLGTLDCEGSYGSGMLDLVLDRLKRESRRA